MNLTQQPTKTKSDLRTPRFNYKPFEYPKAFEYAKKQLHSFWIPDECSLTQDVIDWESKLTEVEKSVIAGVLKGFTQAEIVIGDYWTQVDKWFPKPEISYMAKAFSTFEGIHGESYNLLSETLGIDDFKAFLADPAARARLDNLIDARDGGAGDIARSLAVFSAFAEGVSLFSSFAILMRFPAQNKMKGIGNIIEYSSRDENLHSSAGIWLFKEYCEENPEVRTKDLEEQIYEAALVCVDLEEKFIDSIYNGESLSGINPTDLKNYIRARANLKLKELGYDLEVEYDKKSAYNISSWFDELAGLGRNHDFFLTRSTEYSLKAGNFDPNDLNLDSLFE